MKLVAFKPTMTLITDCSKAELTFVTFLCGSFCIITKWFTYLCNGVVLDELFLNVRCLA